MKHIRNTCLNCGHIVGHQKFCPECGQKTNTARLGMKQILHNFFHVFTHVDSGILFLMKEQFIRPGLVVKEYLDGKRKKYFSPFQYLLLGVAAATFFMVNLDLGIGLFGTIKMTGENAEIILQNFVKFFYKYVNIFMLISLPFMGLFSRFLFRRSGYNYAEHLTLNTFVSAQRNLFFLIAVPFLYYFREQSRSILNISLMVWMTYFVWTYIQFFDPKRRIWGAIKSLIALFLFLFTNGLIVMAVYFILFR